MNTYPRFPPPNPNPSGVLKVNKVWGKMTYKIYPYHYYFKKNWFGGMVLMIRSDVAKRLGFSYWKASKEESQVFMDKFDYYEETVQSVKETHPEALI